jgi:hypothetical protein
MGGTPRPGGRDSAGNFRPRERSKRAQAQCGHWWARVSGGTAWCERCGANMGPAGEGGKGACDCFRRFAAGERHLAMRLASRRVKLWLGVLPA